MWLLVLFVCVGLNCEKVEVLDHFKTLKECEAGVQERWDALEEGKALLCYEVVGDISI